ncbi:MAG TPA: glycosyltransferase [Acidimicrobiales bacterium]|nr:glycosyltransferase [Acidimicrobiales bacterium]
MQINQVMVSARPGDAITTSALELRALLRRVGRSEIFSRYVHERLHHDVWELKDSDWLASESPEDDMIVFHASIGEPAVETFLAGRPERLVVYYHNISPPELFYEYDPNLAGLLESGRRELARLADRAIMAVAVSEYNAAELTAMGYRNVRVAPLITDPYRLSALDPPPDIQARLAALEGPVIVFVGQLLPHKRPDFLLESFHVLTTYLQRPATLVLVGNHRLPRLSQALEDLTRELNLDRVILTGAVSDAELAAWYGRADVFVTASEHEGFCVPPLEAMASGVPVVARRFAALPETIGDAGILLEPGSGPVQMAEAIARVLTDERLRADMIERGHRRVRAYDAAAAGSALLRHLVEAAA